MRTRGISTSNVQLAARRVAAAHGGGQHKLDAILKETPGVKYYTEVAGFSC